MKKGKWSLLVVAWTARGDVCRGWVGKGEAQRSRRRRGDWRIERERDFGEGDRLRRRASTSTDTAGGRGVFGRGVCLIEEGRKETKAGEVGAEEGGFSSGRECGRGAFASGKVFVRLTFRKASCRLECRSGLSTDRVEGRPRMHGGSGSAGLPQSVKSQELTFALRKLGKGG